MARLRPSSRELSPLDPASATVAIVIPCYNEVNHIGATLDAVLRQTFPVERTQVYVVDGMSDDGTRTILMDYASSHRNLTVLDNPRRTIPSALNLGIRASSSDVVVRVDGHTRVAPDYVERCVELLARSGAANVGGRMRPVGSGRSSQAIALALQSRMGVGNSKFHFSAHEEAVDTVYMGAFRREALEEVGGYDESLLVNEDYELNYRLRSAGHTILLSPAILSWYTPRASLARLWVQFYRYGTWKARVLRMHPRSLMPRQAAPPVLVAGLLISLPAYAATRRPLTLFPWVAYPAAVLVSALLGAREMPSTAARLAAALATMHLAWGTGFLLSLFRRAPRDSRSP